MATLPLVSEMDAQLHKHLGVILQQCVVSEAHFLNKVLSKYVDDIKMSWYDSAQTPPDVFSVPDTDPANVL